MTRRAAILAALLLPAATLLLAPASAQAQMSFEIKVQFQNESGDLADVAWVNQNTGVSIAVPDVPAGTILTQTDYWQPLPDVPTQSHGMTITMRGNRGCMAKLDLKMTFGSPGTGTMNAFSCTFNVTSSHNMSCSALATSTFDPATGTGGACDARIRFGG